MKKLLSILSSALILAGCATTDPSLLENVEPSKQSRIRIEPEILRDCKILETKLESGDSFERTLVLRAEEITFYYECYLLNKNKKAIIEKYLLNEKPN